MNGIVINIPAVPVWIVGSYGRDEKADMMAASWCGVAGSVPPSLSVSVKKTSLTYENICFNRAFTIGIVSEDQTAIADIAGSVSGRDADKFFMSDSRPVHGNVVNAPYCNKLSLVYECRVTHMTDIGSHVQIVGEIVNIPVCCSDGFAPLMASPVDRGYYRLGSLIKKVRGNDEK